MYMFLIVLAVIFLVIVVFAFPRFSPVPYFPSNIKDLALVINALHIKDDQTIIDLGAGDGIVIWSAAEKAFQNGLNTQFIALEINPILYLYLLIRRLFHINRKNIIIVRADMFDFNYSSLRPKVDRPMGEITFYAYHSPWIIEKTVKTILAQMKIFRFISYYYPVKSLSDHAENVLKGVHSIYSYQLATSHSS